jgi:DNA-binding NarL/FixJ family response regulator
VPQPLSRPIRVFVADSSPISCQLLAEVIARAAEINVLGFSSNAPEVLRIISASSVDVLLVSAHMEEEPNRGILLLQHLRAEHRGLKAVVLLDSSKPEVVVEAFRSGASGVFCRSGEIELLRKCIVAVHRGQIWANSEELGFVLAALVVDQRFRLDDRQMTSLSGREKQVVRYIVEGLTNREIAETLTISQHTVKNYIFKIFDKMGVSNRVELVFHVLSGGGDLDSIEAHTSAVLRDAAEVYRQDSQFTHPPRPKQVAVLQPGPTRLTSTSLEKAAQ